MEEYGNSMHNTDNPVTLSGLNSKLIIRGVLFYTLLIGFGLLSAQFVMSLLTINLEFYLSVAPLIRITSFFVMVGILISYLFKATSKTNELSKSPYPSNSVRDSIAIFKVLNKRQVKALSFFYGLMFIPIEWLFIFDAKPLDLADHFKTVRQILYNQNSGISNNLYFGLFLLLFVIWICFASGKTVFEKRMTNQGLLKLTPEVVKELHNSITNKEWEDYVLKLLFNPVYHDIIRVFKIEESYSRPGTDGADLDVNYKVYAETVSGIPLEPINIVIRFYEDTYLQLLPDHQSKVKSEVNPSKKLDKKLKEKRKPNLDPQAISDEITEAVKEKKSIVDEKDFNRSDTIMEQVYRQEMILAEKRDERSKFGRSVFEKRKNNSIHPNNLNKKQTKRIGKSSKRTNFNRRG